MLYLKILPRHVSAFKQHSNSFLHNKPSEKKIRFYFIQKYFLYLRDYEKHIDNKFPKAMGLYRLFMDGTKSFIKDLKRYYNIARSINRKQRKLSDFTRKELELYDQLPRDMLKLAPILIFSTFPLTNYIVLPLIYYFPKQLLSQHFWSLQQKNEFNRIILQKRLQHNKPIFRHVQEQLNKLKKHNIYEPWREILGQIGSGTQPNVDQILACKDLFINEPYNLNYLRGSHIKHLLHLHNMHTFPWFRRRRLAEKALLLKEMDLAILREGGVHNLPTDALKMSCYIRGLNPTNMKIEDMVIWMTKWIRVSKIIDYDSASLLLHCPVLLAYNEPSNWTLIYSNTKGNKKNTLV